MPDPVETTDPDGVDYGWVMQTTFVLTIAVGAPVIALLSVGTPLDTWNARVSFAIRVGAVVWVLVAVAVYGYALRTTEG
ncbi:hypothetical protein BRC98_00240 [Halobacteriales archaeon QS_7_68_65]|nr:MAG: hypothetical protein BRC98_00240 [Halobacteriales archaeon QS_7_68_65]